MFEKLNFFAANLSRRRTGLLLGYGLLVASFSGCREVRVTESVPTLVDSASNAVMVLDFDSTRRILNPVYDQIPKDHPQWPMASYLLGIAHWHAQPAAEKTIGRATALLEDLVSSNPESPTTPWALLALARLDEVEDYRGEGVDVDRARERYEEILTKYPGSPAADAAVARLAAGYMKEAVDPEIRRKGLRLIEERLREYPDSVHANALHEIVSDFYLMEKQTDQALKHLKAAEKTGFTNPSRNGDTYFMMALLAEKSGQWKEAVRLHTHGVTGISRNTRAWQSRQRLIELRKARPELKIVVPEIPKYDMGARDSDIPE